MTPTETTTILRQFNEWRRGDEDIPQFDPREIGEAIYAAVEMIERLEAAEKAVAEAYQRGYETGQEEVEKERDGVAQQLVQSEIGKRKISEECDALRAETKNLREGLKRMCLYEDAAVKEAKALRAKVEAMEQQKPVGTLHDDGCFVWRKTAPHESNYAGWKMALYALPGAQPAPSVPKCPYPCGWRNLLKHAIEDGAYLARHINEDDPVTENARAVTMRMVMRLRDVLMAINNAAPEAKP